MEIKGVRGYFYDMRIDKDTVPEGFHFWSWQTGTVPVCPAVISRGRRGKQGRRQG